MIKGVLGFTPGSVRIAATEPSRWWAQAHGNQIIALGSGRKYDPQQDGEDFTGSSVSTERSFEAQLVGS
jgi:hypothetical protein